MIYQRGKRKIYWFRFRFAGRIVHESARTTSKMIARAAERQRRTELERKWNKLEKRELPPTFNTAATKWLEDRKASLAASTTETYRAALAHLRRSFGALLICDFTVQEVARYQGMRKTAGAAAATINKEVICLGSILKKYGLWAELGLDVRMLEEAEVGTALTQEEETRLLIEAAKVGNAGHNQGRWSPIFTVTQLALNTGLRHSEIRRLQWQNVDLCNRLLKVVESKTRAGAGRYVPLNGPALAALDTWAARFPNRIAQTFVFPSCENGKIRLDRPIANWRSAWRRICKAAGLPQLRFHDLRHSTATKLLENAVPYATVAQILGWSATTAVRMAKRYGHIRPEAQRRAVDAIATVGFSEGVHQIDNQIVGLINLEDGKSLKQLM